MKTLTILLLTFIPITSFSQVNFNTGSKELDADLNSINVQAEADFGAFKIEMSNVYNVSSKKINYMKGTIGMKAGEIYLALEIAKIVSKPIDDVINVYKSNKDKGWGYIAKQMGIKPGSKEFHQLKGNASNKKGKGKPGHAGKGKGKSKGKGKKK